MSDSSGPDPGAFDPGSEPTKTSTPVAPGGKPVGAGGHTVTGGSLTHRQRGHSGGIWPFLSVFLPNRVVSKTTMTIIIAVQVVVFLIIWIKSPFKILPTPSEVIDALGNQIRAGLLKELVKSIQLSLNALAWSTVITLALAYLTVIPFFRPIVTAISKGRFLSLAGLTLLATLMTGGGRSEQVMLLTFSITVFYVTSMAAVIAAIPKGDFDHARTLRMSEGRVVWEIVILGTIDKAFEVLRQNAAIGWMMITMIEGIVRSEGGVGVQVLNEGKYFHLANVYAIQLLILIVGLLQDYGIGLIRKICCPYADLTLERK